MPNLDLEILKIMSGDTEVLKVMQGDTKVWGKHLITCNFDGVTSDAPIGVADGGVLSAALTGADGKSVIPSSVVVTMGGVDVTDTTYNFETNRIEIASVSGDVVISAEGAVVDSAYVPTLFVFHHTASSQDSPIQTDYMPNSNTEMDIDVDVERYDTYTTLFGTSSMDTNPRYYFYIRYVYLDYSQFYFGSKAKNSASSTRIANGIRQNVVVNKNSITYTNNNGGRTTLTATTNTFQSTRGLHLGGTQTSPNVCRHGSVKIYRWKISEEDVLMRDYIPVQRISDGLCGVYDLVNGTFISRPRAKWYKEMFSVTRTLTNCTQAVVGNTFAAYYVIGEEWASTFSPSSGYTFNSEDALFQVLINDEDKTSDVATYDSETDKWSVAYTPHWSDTIEITATTITTSQ